MLSKDLADIKTPVIVRSQAVTSSISKPRNYNLERSAPSFDELDLPKIISQQHSAANPILTLAEFADEVKATIELFGQLTNLQFKVDQDRDQTNTESKSADQTQLHFNCLPTADMFSHQMRLSVSILLLKHATNSFDGQDLLLSPEINVYGVDIFRIAKSVVRVDKGKWGIAIWNTDDKLHVIPQFTILAKLQATFDTDQLISADEIFSEKLTDRELEKKSCDICEPLYRKVPIA